MLAYVAVVLLAMVLAAANCLVPALILAIVAVCIALRPEIRQARDRTRGPQPTR